LTEISGIPFGLMGEMLQDGGNPWRGMLFGMTARLPWAGDPRPLWQVWDDFGIGESRMIGFWVHDRPVKSGHADIMITSYLRPGKALLAIASWADEDEEIALRIDWQALGLDQEKCTITAREIENFQSAASFDPVARFTVPRGKGWLLEISEKQDGGK
jgi:hypothetical protein